MKKTKLGARVLAGVLAMVTVLTSGDWAALTAQAKKSYAERAAESAAYRAAEDPIPLREFVSDAGETWEVHMDGTDTIGTGVTMESQLKASPDLGLIGHGASGRSVWTTDPSTDLFSGNPKIYVGDEEAVL